MEGGTKHVYMLTGLGNAHHTKDHMANKMHQPYGLSCQLLGLHPYACGSNNLCHNHLLWARLCPTQLLFYTAWERITAQYPPVTDSNFVIFKGQQLGGRQGMAKYNGV